jgi:PAS domain S-box-containing protein
LSLGLRLLLLVLIAAVPVMAVPVVDQLNERQEQRREIATNAVRIAELFSEQLSQVVEAARGLAVATAHMPEVRNRDAEACVARVRELIRQFPQFVGIGVVGPDGRTFCRTSEGPQIDISDRAYFQEVLREGRFTASGYIIGRNIQRPSVVFAAPAFGEAGEVSAVVVVAYDLRNLPDVLTRMTLPDDASVSLIDSEGIMVARVPAAEGAIGRQARGPALMEAIRAQRRGAVTAEGVDGVERVYGFAPLVEPARFYAMVGLPLAPALAAIDNRLWRSLGLLGGIFLLAAIAAMTGGELTIRRPLGQLQKQAERLAAGDLAARSQLNSAAIGEVGALAASLDEMARAVADRQTALAASEEFNRRVLESSHDGIKILDVDGRLLAINDRGARSLEIADPSEVRGTFWPDLWADDSRPAVQEALAAARAGKAGRFSGLHRRLSERDTWWDVIVSPIPDAEGKPERLLVISRDITEIKQAGDEREALLAELDHRVKNSLAAIQSIAVQTLRPGADVAAFTGRLEAMAKAHNLLSKSGWQGAELSVLLQTMLAGSGERIALAGPPVRLKPKMTQTLGMAVHELATNAAKYGALSEAGGEVVLEWRLEGEGQRRLVLEWQERGGPPAAEPGRRDFGLTFIERSLAHEFGGVVELDFRPGGLYCRMDLPLGRGTAADLPEAEAAPAAAAMQRPGAAGLVGSRILLVEDEALAAMEMELLLKEAGCEVVGPASRLDRALALAEAGGFDAAALDVNLDGEFVFPLAARLREQGVPFVFMTGYNSRGVFPPEFQDVTRVGKPVQERALTAALAEAIAAAAPEPSRKTA